MLDNIKIKHVSTTRYILSLLIRPISFPEFLITYHVSLSDY